MLCDTGPLVALIDRNDPNHSVCAKALALLPPVPLITTWLCVTEAMHLLYRSGGLVAQNALWRLCERLHRNLRDERRRME